MLSNEEPQATIACNFGAIAPDERTTHGNLAHDLFGSVVEIRELEQGYGFRFLLENTLLQQSMDFITNERLCCPFFTFTQVIGQQFWLEITGTQDVKVYIKQIMVDPLAENGVLPDVQQWIADHTT